MKAKVIKTGEIVEVVNYYAIAGYIEFKVEGLDDYGRISTNKIEILSDNHNEIDWEQRRFELVKAAFCGLNANSYDEILRMDKETIARLCVKYADAVIAELKEESV